MSICDVYILVAAQHDIPHALGQLSIVGRRRPLPLPGRRSGISMGLITPTQLYQRHLLGEIFNPFAGLFSQLLVSGMTLWLLKERNRVMCGVQSYLSCVLFSTHIQKKVCVFLCAPCIKHNYVH